MSQAQEPYNLQWKPFAALRCAVGVADYGMVDNVLGGGSPQTESPVASVENIGKKQ